MDHNRAVQVSVLGPVEVRRDGDLVPVPGARLQTLLARLALSAGRPVAVGALLEAVWGADQPHEETNALQSLVSRLRRALGEPGAVEQSAGGYRLAAGGWRSHLKTSMRCASNGWSPMAGPSCAPEPSRPRSGRCAKR